MMSLTLTSQAQLWIFVEDKHNSTPLRCDKQIATDLRAKEDLNFVRQNPGLAV